MSWCGVSFTAPFRLAWAAGLALSALAGAGLSGAALAQPQAPSAGGIYTCFDEKGRRLTSDRPIAECSHKEQQILNRDGSLRGVHPATLTAEERAERDARERRAAEQRQIQADAARRDKNLLSRYPSEVAHRKAREAALDNVRVAMKSTEQRLKELEVERKPLLSEAEFYKGKRLPGKLKAAMDANDAAMEAQREVAAQQEAEVVRVNRLYDNELGRLQKLWAGALPGSMGPLPAPGATPARATAGASATSAAPPGSTAPLNTTPVSR